jgi:predicted tellurium resistance membrane protein TerC
VLLVGFALLSNHFERRHVPQWHVAIAYVIGFLVMLALLGWRPDTKAIGM